MSVVIVIRTEGMKNRSSDSRSVNARVKQAVEIAQIWHPMENRLPSGNQSGENCRADGIRLTADMPPLAANPHQDDTALIPVS